MTFYVGQKVAPIRIPGFVDLRPRLIAPLDMKGVYTVREIDTRGIRYGHSVATMRLEEIVGEIVETFIGRWEVGYRADAFRPLVTRSTETGMAILRELLNTNPADSRLKEAI